VRTDSPLWRSARRASGTRTFSHVVGILERAARPLPGVLNVLTYHRVDEPEDAPELYPGLNGATPDEFEEHMRFLASSCRTLSLSELLAVRRGEAPLPSHAVLVTFDDGYRSVAEHAWPIMQRQGVPLTLFVPTAYPGRPGNAFWWDRLWSALEGRHSTPDERLRTYRRLRERVKSLPHEQAMAYVDELGGGAGAESRRPSVLDWDELRRLAAEGVALGPHSRTHPLLDKVARADANEEILGSLGDLEREVGPVPRVFAYPGGAGEGMSTLLEEQGFELAFLTRRGVNDVSRPDWLRLRRINVGRSFGLTGIRVQLLSQWARIQRMRERKTQVFTHGNPAWAAGASVLGSAPRTASGGFPPVSTAANYDGKRGQDEG
jgi:peptidoglycan/xylan/chitin deacetylase (PgdA/CDA1 family)